MPFIVSIVGKSDSGKTTLLEALIKVLKQRGRRIAVIKHAADDFELDTPNKDSWRFSQAGSEVSAISSKGKLAVVRRLKNDPDPQELAQYAGADCDLVLTEGFKQHPYPKIEITPPRILSKMEYRALRDACRREARISAVVELLLQTGIRIGELRRLKLSDIEFGENDKPGQIRIGSWGKNPERFVPLNQPAQEALKGYLDVRPKAKEETVFITKTGRPFLIRNIRTTINRYFKVAGIENAKVNDLRHTFVATHLSRGVPLTTVSRLAGHRRLTTTEKYIQYIDPQSMLPFIISIEIIIVVLIGGRGTVFGPLIGALIFIPLSEYCRTYLGGMAKGYDYIIIGLLVLLLAIKRPEGLVGFRRS